MGSVFFQLQIAVASLKRVVLGWGDPPKKLPHKSVCVFFFGVKIFLSNCFRFGQHGLGVIWLMCRSSEQLFHCISLHDSLKSASFSTPMTNFILFMCFRHLVDTFMSLSFSPMNLSFSPIFSVKPWYALRFLIFWSRGENTTCHGGRHQQLPPVQRHGTCVEMWLEQKMRCPKNHWT